MIHRLRPLILTALLLLAGCGTLDFWPFQRNDTGSIPNPENATLYKCDSNKSFWLRTLKDGAMWVIYPDRQVRLDKMDSDPKKFSNNIATLDMSGPDVSLNDGPQIAYSGCKATASK
jgi:hypothetical protein